MLLKCFYYRKLQTEAKGEKTVKQTPTYTHLSFGHCPLMASLMWSLPPLSAALPSDYFEANPTCGINALSVFTVSVTKREDF